MPSGIQIKAAVKKAAVWGTPVACGANNGILLIGDSMKRKIENNPDHSLGLDFTESRDQGNKDAGGALPAYLRYDSLELLIALVMGTAGAPAQQGATAAYKHTLVMKDILDGLFATLAINKVVNVDEYASIKIVGLTMKGTMGKPVEISFDVIADDKLENSATNDLTSFANVTYRETANRVLMSQGVFRLNTQSGGALATPGDVVNLSEFELSFKRNDKGEYVTGNANKLDEPTADENPPEVTLKLTFPRYTSNADLLAYASQTAKKGDIVFTGGLIEAPYNREFKIQMPNLSPIDADAATETGKVKKVLEFACDACSAAPTGMAGITKPFQIDLINTLATDPLA